MKAFAMDSIRTLIVMTCLALGGCVFGYYAPAPKGYDGDWVISSGGAIIDSCSLGPGLWSGTTPGLCIYPPSYACAANSSCKKVPAGTPVRVLGELVREGEDVSLRVGRDDDQRVVHTLYWDRIKPILERP
jgi:hypothetical protein